MAGKSKGPKLTPMHQCCLHIAGATGFNPGPTGQPQFIAQIQVCCQCGKSRAHYNGLLVPGHGPFLTFEQPEPLVSAKSKLVLPGRA